MCDDRNRKNQRIRLLPASAIVIDTLPAKMQANRSTFDPGIVTSSRNECIVPEPANSTNFNQFHIPESGPCIVLRFQRQLQFGFRSSLVASESPSGAISVDHFCRIRQMQSI
jgi:hypothetical protein